MTQCESRRPSTRSPPCPCRAIFAGLSCWLLERSSARTRLYSHKWDRVARQCRWRGVLVDIRRRRVAIASGAGRGRANRPAIDDENYPSKASPLSTDALSSGMHPCRRHNNILRCRTRMDLPRVIQLKFAAGNRGVGEVHGDGRLGTRWPRPQTWLRAGTVIPIEQESRRFLETKSR